MERLHQAATCFRSADAPDQWTASPVAERSEALGVVTKLLEAKAARRAVQKGRPAWAGDAKAASLLCEVAISRLSSGPELPKTGGDGDAVFQVSEPSPGRNWGMRHGKGRLHHGPASRAAPGFRAIALLCTASGACLMYVRQELSAVLLRLLKACDQEDVGRDLKAAYCSLLTAWHEASGQVEALTAVAAQTRKVLRRDLLP
eukprot:s7534_g5.t1